MSIWGTSNESYLDARDYGLALNCRGVNDAVVAAGSLSRVTSATAAFTAADTGRRFTLASTAGAVTTGTLTFVSATACDMSVAAGAAMTGARLILGTDDTAAWQAALNAADPGQTVDASGFAWRSLCAGQLSVPVGVKLGFAGRGPFDPDTNPAMNTWGPTFVVIQHATTPFVTLARGAGIGDYIIYSANQVPPTAPTATALAPLIHCTVATGGQWIGSPYMPNAYDAIRIYTGRVTVDRPQIGNLHHGLLIDYAEDVVDIDWVTVHPYWRICEGQVYTPAAASLDAYALTNAWAVRIHRADAFKIGAIFSYGNYGTVLLIDSDDGAQTPPNGYGMIGMVDADTVAVGIQAYETQSPGVLIGQALLGANGTGVGTAGSAGISTVTGGSTAPKLVLSSWSHRGVWSTSAASTGVGTTLIVPGTNPG